MKTRDILITSIFLIILAGCSKERITSDDFSIVINGTQKYSLNDIEFYDYSTHLVYLKDGTTFSYDGYGSFQVLVAGKEIYSGSIHPGFSSMLPMGPHIACMPSHYDDYIISFGFRKLFGPDGIELEDPREDHRIRDALNRHGKLRDGLSCEIISVEFYPSNKKELTLKISNNDQSEILYLDPEKMGTGLFHYFTNGLTLYDRFEPEKSYTHHTEIVMAEPWNDWQKDWLSVLGSQESKTISITYNDFDQMVPGQYRAVFTYPGLSYQVKREELFQPQGRIWLGSTDAEKLFFLLNK
jgi:hypothetical protein